MFGKRFETSIRFRFLVIMTSVLLVSTSVLSAVIAINEGNLLNRSLTTKGRSFALYIAKLSQDPVIMQDTILLDSLVNEANEDEDALYTVIRDVQGKLLTSQYASINFRSQRVKAVLAGLSRDSELQDVISAIKRKESVAEMSVPIMTGADTIGMVTIGMSEHMINQLIIKTILLVIALNLAVALAIGTVLFVSSRRLILDPITELAQATSLLAKGDLSVRVKTGARGEVRMLVDSFNQMAEDLGKRTRQLLDAQEELVRKEKLSILGQLAGIVGHELRNPLGVMNNAVYFLKTVMNDADDTVREYLGIIKQEIDNSQRIITDLLDFARTKTPRTIVVAVPDLIAEVLGKCTIPPSVETRLDIADTLPAVTVDPFQMGQVLQNLITNAVQAMPGGGTLSIIARPVSAVLEILVRDTGEGIPPENLEKLFQPLFTTKTKGIGLGLTVCKNLTEANGGEIRVESRLGEGTTFFVRLPLVGKGESADANPAGPSDGIKG